MREISSEELLKGLLGYGLFAEKLPPIFTSRTFYDYCKTRKFSRFEKKACDYVRYDSIRNTNVPRKLAIPNPFAYMHLCVCIHSCWDKIIKGFEKNTSNQKYKCSQIHIRKIKGKERLFEMNLSYEDKEEQLEVELCKLPILKRFKVNADISSCYPSIYTHALSWALVEKAKAKRERGNDLWYNRLDQCCRNTKYGETNGLHIGPHTSNLLAEVVLCRIDKELVKLGYKYIRNIDDYECYVNSEDEAEEFLLDLSRILKTYELDVNTRKVKIQKLPLPLDTDWVRALNEFYKGDDKTCDGMEIFKYRRLRTYLDIVITLVRNTGNYAVLTYAIKSISSCYLGEKAKAYYIETLHQLVCWCPYLVHYLDDYVFHPFSVSKEQIAVIAQDLYDIGIKKHIFEACSFALYWALKYAIEIKGKFVKESIKSSDCVFLLLSYLYAKKKRRKNDERELRQYGERLLQDFDRYWLFIYEVLPQTKLSGDFLCLKKAGISFIKEGYR